MVLAWMQLAEKALAAVDESTSQSKPAQARLRYVALPAAGGIQIQGFKQRLRKDGSLAAEDRWHNFVQAYRNPPSFADDQDLIVFDALARFAEGTDPHFTPLVLKQRGASHALRQLALTGRLHWLGSDGPLLKIGPARDLRLSWTLEKEGYEPRFEIDDDTIAELMTADTPWAVIERSTHAELCPLRTDLSTAWLRLLRIAPPLSQEHALRLKLAAGERPGFVPDVGVNWAGDVRVRPVLHLFTGRPGYGKAPRGGFPTRYGARLSFLYDDVEVTEADPSTTVALGGKPPRHTHRDRGAEQRWTERFNTLGLQAAMTPYHASEPVGLFWPSQESAIRFVIDEASKLRAEGWELRYSDDWPLHPQEASDFSGHIESSGVDWLELHLTAAFGEERIALPELLAGALYQYGVGRLRTLLGDESAKTDPNARVIFPNGERLLSLPLARVRGLLALLLELFDGGELPSAGKPLRLSRFDLLRLSQLEADSGALWRGRTMELARRLREFQGIASVPPPQGLQTTLRDYQLQGLAWAQFLREYNLAGVLADEMGLGKTVQTLAHLLTEKAAGRLDRPALVVAPTSVIPNWEHEAQRLAPSLRCMAVHGQGRAALFNRIKDHDLVLTSYPLLGRDAEHWLRQSFHLVVLDEAQFIKNAKTQAAQVACRLDTRHRLALSGTPMENHLGEIWSLFHFLMPGLLGDEKRFERVYRRPIEKNGDTLCRDELIRRLSPFVLRRSKDRVAAELPAKTEILLPVPFGRAQRDLYETVRSAMDEKVRQAVKKQGLARSQIAILDALLKLRQVCCDPRLLPAARQGAISGSVIKAAGSAKLDALMDLLAECRDNNRRALVFSQFTSMLDIVEAKLIAAGISQVRLDGSTQDRTTPVQRFQAGEADVFLISLKAGGSGLNLTAADTVIHYDPWWNPAVEAQATGRAHRIGQDKPVFVYRLVCEGSIEEKIIKLQERKAGLASGLLDGSAQDTFSLDANDLEQLLAPLPSS